MRGHQPILTMRSQGAAPRIIFIDDSPCCFKSWQTWHINTPDMAHVEIEPADLIAGLDLRFAFGMTVVITSPDRERLEILDRAFQMVPAARVVAATINRGPDGFRVETMSDTGAA